MFNFITEEHRLIADSARKVFEDLAAADTARRQTAKTRIDGGAVRSALSDLGVFGRSIEDRAMSCAQVQTLIAREAGAACLPFPVLEALAAHAVIMRSPQLAGEAWDPGLVTLSLTDSEGTASCRLAEGLLDGGVELVPFAQTADAVLVRVLREDGVALAHTPLAVSGTRHVRRATVEADYPVYDLRFEQVPAATFDRLDNGEPAEDALRQRTSLLAAAELAGVCRRMVGMTRDYLVSRTQFGAPLGSNQALKHALADALVRVEAMNAAIDYAAAASDADAADATSAVCAAKMYAGRSGKSIADAMLQLHGAIGYTMEYPLQLFMRRAYRLNATHGSAREHGERLFKSFVEA
jgi:alkylation response protein AidB-like acyl-CoA dehydrogenase